jgi:DNA-binding NarL/FixJ family response regulator
MPLNKFDFTRTEYEYFLSECPFTDEEKAVFELRRMGKSIIAISFELNMSESTVSRRIKSILKKVKKAI